MKYPDWPVVVGYIGTLAFLKRLRAQAANPGMQVSIVQASFADDRPKLGAAGSDFAGL